MNPTDDLHALFARMAVSIRDRSDSAELPTGRRITFFHVPVGNQDGAGLFGGVFGTTNAHKDCCQPPNG